MKTMRSVLVAAAGLVLVYTLALAWLSDPDASLSFNRAELRADSLRFGSDFLWGSSSSAYQTEGNTPNCNWAEYESTVDAQGRPPIAHGERCGRAADFWNRYREDIGHMKELHLNAFRFSVEWSKVEPAEGVFVDSVLEHYRDIVRELRANGIEPMVTLHHFTDPLWFDRRGGFESGDAPEIFARYADTVARRLGAGVRFWSTINEPNVYAVEGYYRGTFPPGVHDPARAFAVMRNLLRTHTACYRVIRAAVPGAQVGLPLSIFLMDPPQWWNIADVLLARYLNRAFSVSVIDYLRTGVLDVTLPGIVSEHFDSGVPGAFDFIGLNYYSRLKFHFDPGTADRLAQVQAVPRAELTDKGWEIYPDGLYRALKMISSRTAKPIYITENGIADDGDQKRAGFIEDHLRVANRAVRDGMNLKGYFYWSLTDNFEWVDGFDVRFGLYAVDYATEKRTLRAGSLRYLELIMQWENLRRPRAGG